MITWEGSFMPPLIRVHGSHGQPWPDLVLLKWNLGCHPEAGLMSVHIMCLQIWSHAPP